MGFTVRENLRIHEDRFDQEMDKAIKDKDMVIKVNKMGLTLNPKAIHLPLIKSGMNTPTTKDVLTDPLKNRSNSIS